MRLKKNPNRWVMGLAEELAESRGCVDINPCWLECVDAAYEQLIREVWFI